MSAIGSLTDDFGRAFRLAYFIHADKAVSLEIATVAMAKLEVAAAAQAKRLYYRPRARMPGNRGKAAGFRSKVTLGDLQLLQRLVFLESEPHERQGERPESSRKLTQDDMVVRFVKYLAQITVKRNSFYVTLGVSRLLHDYDTADAMRMYDSILGDASRIKDDDYYRSRKAMLMKEITKRFGASLTAVRGRRGEERFQSAPPSADSMILVTESLNQFTPWSTPCLVPEGVVAVSEGIPGLSAKAAGAQDEHTTEVNRMHAILHPECFRRLAAALGLDLPDRRLEVPVFSLSNQTDDKEGPPGDRRRPPTLSGDEISAVDRQLAEEAARRKSFSARLLRVLVDGIERARLDTDTASAVRLEIDGGTELIEVRGRDRQGEPLLATHLVRGHPEGSPIAPAKTAIVLEGGQRVSFSIVPRKDASGETIGFWLEVGYRKARLSDALFRREDRERIPVFRPLIALAVLALLSVGIVLVLGRGSREAPAPRLGERQISPAAAPTRGASLPDQTAAPQIAAERPPFPLPPHSSAGGKEERPSRQREERVAVWAPGRGKARETNLSSGEQTRALGNLPASLSLAAVKKIFVDCGSQEFRDLVAGRLAASGKLAVTENRDKADAALRISVRPIGDGEATQVNVTARLVNASGIALWPASGASHGRYEGKPADSATRLATDLLEAKSRAKSPK